MIGQPVDAVLVILAFASPFLLIVCAIMAAIISRILFGARYSSPRNVQFSVAPSGVGGEFTLSHSQTLHLAHAQQQLPPGKEQPLSGYGADTTPAYTRAAFPEMRRAAAAGDFFKHAELVNAYRNVPIETLSELTSIMEKSSKPASVYSSRPEHRDRAMISGR